jgi:hypothetical protein
MAEPCSDLRSPAGVFTLSGVCVCACAVVLVIVAWMSASAAPARTERLEYLVSMIDLHSVFFGVRLHYSLHQFDLPQPPSLVELRFERALEAQRGVPAFAGS